MDYSTGISAYLDAGGKERLAVAVTMAQGEASRGWISQTHPALLRISSVDGLDPEALDFRDLPADLRRHGRVDAELLFAHQGFAGELQQNAAVTHRHIGRLYRDPPIP